MALCIGLSAKFLYFALVLIASFFCGAEIEEELILEMQIDRKSEGHFGFPIAQNVIRVINTMAENAISRKA